MHIIIAVLTYVLVEYEIKFICVCVYVCIMLASSDKIHCRSTHHMHIWDKIN